MVRNKFGALLKGLLNCVPCGCAMSPSHSTHDGTKRYRYYVCTAAQKRGWDTCPSRSIPAGEVEQFVVEQIKCIGRDPRLVADGRDRQRRFRGRDFRTRSCKPGLRSRLSYRTA